MSRGNPGLQCRVEGCARSGRVAVNFPNDDPVSTVDYIDENDERGEGLLVCFTCGEKLGPVQSYADVGDPDAFHVTIDPERAVGWRLCVIVRKSGRHAVCLFPPEVEQSTVERIRDGAMTAAKIIDGGVTL